MMRLPPQCLLVVFAAASLPAQEWVPSRSFAASSSFAAAYDEARDRLLDLAALVPPLPFTATAGGVGSVRLPIPAVPTLAGRAVYLQGAVLDPAGPWQGLVVTRDLQACIGS
ncbi:MAG: hypothetical protein AAF628_21685 [Planctomycetota bacterium]